MNWWQWVLVVLGGVIGLFALMVGVGKYLKWRYEDTTQRP